jgi:hypothetical protein
MNGDVVGEEWRGMENVHACMYPLAVWSRTGEMGDSYLLMDRWTLHDRGTAAAEIFEYE